MCCINVLKSIFPERFLPIHAYIARHTELDINEIVLNVCSINSFAFLSDLLLPYFLSNYNSEYMK